MEIRKGKGLHPSVSVLESLFGLSGKSDDHIRTDRDLWNTSVQFPDKVIEEEMVIISIHPLQDLIVSALDGDVEVGTYFC
jgi:hypothetical protein